MTHKHYSRLPGTVINDIPVIMLLVRHGEPVADDMNSNEADRPLTQRGVAQAHQLAHTLELMTKPTDVVICSLARRSRETADALFSTSREKPPRIFMEDLYPNISDDTVRLMDDNRDCTVLSEYFAKVGSEQFKKYAYAFHLHFSNEILIHLGKTEYYQQYTNARPLSILIVGHATYLQAIALQYAGTPEQQEMCVNTSLQFCECLRMSGTLSRIDAMEYVR